MANKKNPDTKASNPPIKRGEKNLQPEKFTDEYFMKLAFLQLEESHCIRPERRVGAIAVLNNKIIAGGANGTVGKIPSCGELGYCIRQKLGIAQGEKLEVTYCVCGEQRLICSAARNGIALKGAVVYVTRMPCAICIRLLIEAGISRVYYRNDYPSPFTKEICDLAQFDLIKI
jgi:dCMP deaminase